jgi:hypothetical protein
MSLVSSSCLWHVLAPKVLQLCTNHFVLVLCRFVWVIEACQFFLVPSWNSSTPLYPSKVLRARERAPIPYFLVVFNLGFTFESLKELGARHKLLNRGLFNYHVHFKQPHNNMYGHSSLIQNINNQSKSIHTTMRHFKKKFDKNNCCKCKIWQNTLVHYLLDHVKQHFFHKRKPRKFLNMKASFEVKCFHKWTKACNPCKYTTSNPPEIVVEHHHFL